MKTKYIVRYSHYTAETTTSLRHAKALARLTAGVKQLSYFQAKSGDPIFCWKTLKDQEKDETGWEAFAVIEKMS
jgi:hypothetical protein